MRTAAFACRRLLAIVFPALMAFAGLRNRALHLAAFMVSAMLPFSVSAALAPGEIVFVGVNTGTSSDGDWIAFAALTNIPAGTVIYITDNELASGAATSFNTGESYSKWTAPAGGTSAGTVILITQFDSSTPTASTGTAEVVAVASSTNRGLSTTAESIYAFLAANDATAATPTTHLARINIGNAEDGSVPDSLPADSRISFTSSQDSAVYSGVRSGETNFAAYKAIVNNPTNWTLGAATASSALSTTAFSIGAPVSVNLSVSANAGTEAAATSITVTATATAAVSGNQTLSVGVSGTGIVAGDYSLSNATLTIPDGTDTGSVTFTVVNDTLLEGEETATLTISNPSSGIALGTTTTQNILLTDDETAIDLSRYVRVGRYDLPFSASAPLLCSECSAVTYNWDTDTLFVVGDEGSCIVQVSKTGVQIDFMTLSGFEDTESLTYIGGGQFVMAEERLRQANLITYTANTTLLASSVQKVKLGTTVGNIGLEGVSYDPLTSGYLFVKEKDPKSIFQTQIDFGAGTATNGSPSTIDSTDLFNPALANVTDFSDVFALCNLPALNGTASNNHLLIISQEAGQVLHLDRSGTFFNALTIVADPGSPLSVPDMTHEGVTMDRDGFLYIVTENGGGDPQHPQLWVYAPSNATNVAPTAISLINAVSSLPDNTSTTTAVKLADMVVADDGLGTNTLSISGTDAADFQIIGTSLFLKAGTVLNSTTKPSYSITLNVDDTTVGTTPDAFLNYALTVTAAPVGSATLVISEVAPWSSGNSTLVADWFEVTNIGSVAATITGWKVDDSSSSFASAVALNGITSIAPGESVIFIETNDLAGKSAAFKTLWFGASPPAALQIGNYTGSGIGLGTGGDAVNLFDSAGVIQASVTFGASPGAAPFATFDNSDRLNNATITTLSSIGVNGAAAAVSDPTNEIGSPGVIGTPSTPIITIALNDATASEDGLDAGTFRVTRTGSTVSPLSFNYSIATGAGQAINGTDYTPTLSGAGVIPSGASFVDITITPVDDGDLEGSETVTLTLGDTGSLDVGVPGSATLTIADNEINLPPTAVMLNNTVATLVDSASTASAIRVADIAVTDDGAGTNTLTLSGADAAAFEITGNQLFLKAGTVLNIALKPTYAVTVHVDDTTVGTTPDASVNYALSLFAGGTIVITEISPWSSGAASPLGADWFEVTNIGSATVNISGWKFDDDSRAIGNAVALNGVTQILPGESVIFLETNDLPTKSAEFKTLWFGANPPASLQIGNYTGSGVGLSGSGDQVNLFDAAGKPITGVSFGTSPVGPTFGTFDNTAGAGSSTTPLPSVSTLSTVGVNNAFAAANDANEIGSPGAVETTLIHDVQGSGASSPLTAQTVTVDAIVVGDFQNGDGDTQRNLGGFYLQEESADTDANASTSEGIFVFEGSGSFKADVALGDRVRVTGVVQENFGFTQISAATVRVVQAGALADVSTLRVNVGLPAAGVTLNQNGAAQPDLEAFEGMLVRFPDTLTISEQFNLDRFNEIKLSAGGRPETFTNANTPSVAGYASFLSNVGSRKITYDDGLNIQNAAIDNLAGFAPYSNATAPRMGDTITGLSGVLDYQWAGNSASGSTWRVRAITTNGNTFVNTNPRPATHDPVGGRLKVGSLNVLNYFKTLDASSAVTAIGLDPRGANSQAEFDRQTAKLVKVLLALDADVLGLTELENDFDAASPGNALKYLVEQLNLQAGAGTYAAVNPGSQFLGGDAIAVGFIYKPATVQIATNTTIESLNDADVDAALLAQSTIGRIFDGANTSRNALAVTFAEIGTGEKFTAVINHLKSKSGTGTGADADQLDGQGNWQKQRELAAQALVTWAATDPTGSNDNDFLLLGDFNAYLKEDALSVIKSAGYHNIAEERLSSAYSYVFDAQFGSLDHVFANTSLNFQVTGVTEWHINADEADALDYNLDFGRDPAIFDATSNARESDHDPILIGLALQTVVPVVTLNTAKLANTATSIVINGTGFSTTPGNNSVAFNLGAAGTVTAASATQLTVTFTTQPGLGNLTAVVTSLGVSSGAPVQVARVVPIVTVTAENKTRTYGAANPALTYTSSGLLNGDTLDGALATTAVAASAVGGYGITQGTLDSANYIVSFTGGTLTVTAATINVSAENKSKPFGSANPALTFTYSGFVNGETSAVVSGTPVLATTAVTGSAVGTYPISVSLTGVSAPNYTFAVQDGTLTVTSLAAAITGVTPVFGPTSGGTTLTISGTNLLAGSTVTIGGLAATGVAFNNGQITAVTPAHAAGKVDVQVSSPNSTPAMLANAFEYNDAPTVGSGITLTPAVASVGQPVSATVAATDPEGALQPITYNWGDGITGASSSHVYANPGVFTLTVTVSDGLTTLTASTTVTVVAAALPGGEVDSDGDGISDTEEIAANTNPNNAGSAPASNGANPLEMPPLKLNVTLNFNERRTNNDSIALTGTLPIAQGFTPGGKTFIVNVGGVVKSFTLDSKGVRKNGGDLLTVSSPRNGVSKFTARFTKGNFKASLADEGLTDTTTPKKGSQTTVKVNFIYDGKMYQQLRSTSYKATQGKTGRTK